MFSTVEQLLCLSNTLLPSAYHLLIDQHAGVLQASETAAHCTPIEGTVTSSQPDAAAGRSISICSMQLQQQQMDFVAVAASGTAHAADRRVTTTSMERQKGQQQSTPVAAVRKQRWQQPQQHQGFGKRP